MTIKFERDDNSPTTDRVKEIDDRRSELNDGLGPLPEARWLLANGDRPYCDSYSADQMRAYAAEQVAAERERWAGYMRRALAESELVERLEGAGHAVLMPYWVVRDPDA